MCRIRRKDAAAGLIAVILLWVWALPLTGEAVADAAAPEQPAVASSLLGDGLVLRASTDRRIVVELSLPKVGMDPIWIGGEQYVSLSAPGLTDSSLAGQPRLPQTAVLIGLPPTGGWSVRLLEVEHQIVPLALPVVSVPTADAAAPGSAKPEGLSLSPVPSDPVVYSADGFYPASPVDEGEALLLHDLRVLRLGLNPVRYNPVRGQLEQIRRLVVEVLFEEAQGRQEQRHPAMLPHEHDAWDAVLGRAVLNYDVARAWRGVRPAVEKTAPNPPATEPGSFKVEVERDGLYLLTYGDLATAGFPVASVNPSNLHLVVGGQEVAIQVEVGPDGKFTPGDWLLFYGQAALGRYTIRNIYWLYSGGTPGLRMTSRSVVPHDVYPVPSTRRSTAHMEENHFYDGLYPEPNGDHWYWTDLGFLQTECPAASQDYSFDLPQLSTGVYDAKLRTSIQGHTFNTHTLSVTLNGNSVGNIAWDGPTRMDSELTFPGAWLKGQGNILKLENGDCPPRPASPNQVVFNYFEVEHFAGYEATTDDKGNPLLDFWGEPGGRQYQLSGFSSANVGLFDLTDPHLPVSLTGAEWMNGQLEFQDVVATPRHYVVIAQASIRTPPIYRDSPSNLASPLAKADYLLIGYGPFLPATQSLVDLRAAQGLTVMSVDVQDVYDEFSFGVLDPVAVRDFLAYVAAEWEGPPTYVLLVGDGTIDYHDYRGNGWHNFLPAFPANVELHAGPYPAETASDRALDPGAALPLFQLGRLPVASVEQAQAMVAKIVRYETAPPPPLWNRRALFVADRADTSQGEESFAERSDEVFHSLIAPLQGDRIYLAAQPTQPFEYEAQTARAAVRERFVLGQLVVTYMGHSSHSQWSVDILLHRDDVPLLQNDGRLPVVLSMTCYTGAFQWPDYAPLDERLVVEPTGGAVAAWGSTGAAVSAGHRQLAQGFFDALQAQERVRLGTAAYAGLVRLYTLAPTARDLIDTYVLLGDPAMVLDKFTGTALNNFLPLVLRGH